MANNLKFITAVRGGSPDVLAFEETLRPRQSLFSGLKEALLDLIFEEEERPIGMSQLSRQTYLAPPNQPGVFFRNMPTFQDYSFLKAEETVSHGQTGGPTGRY